MINLIRDLLSENEINELKPEFLNALRQYSQLFNESKAKEKFKFLRPIKLAGITYRKAKAIGFRATAYMWANCLMTNTRNKGIMIKLKINIIKTVKIIST